MKLRQLPLLSSALAVAIIALSASAADSSSLPGLSTAEQATGTGNAAASTTAAAVSTTASNTAKTTAKTDGTTESTSIQTSTAQITGSTASASSATAPSISGTSAASDAALTGLPTLSGIIKAVTVTVPPTSNAPFMQQSSLPDGTVFIVVGAILGFMALAVLLWRTLIAWSLHRSITRAAMQQLSDTKQPFRHAPPSAPFYKYSDRDSTISLGGIGGKRGKKAERPSTAQTNENRASLFFSPTAGAAGISSTPGNRSSNYLPAGYYAAGASAIAGGQGQVPIGGGQIPMSNLGPDRYSRARSMVGPSPPDSPAFTATTRTHGGGASSSTLNLNSGYGGNERAPSAYLEDLFDGEGAPPVPGHQHPHGGRF